MYVPKTVYMKQHQIRPPVPSQNMLPPGKKECNPVSLNLCFTNQYAPSVEVIWIFFQLLLCFLHLLWDVLCRLLRGERNDKCETRLSWSVRNIDMCSQKTLGKSYSYFGYITVIWTSKVLNLKHEKCAVCTWNRAVIFFVSKLWKLPS